MAGLFESWSSLPSESQAAWVQAIFSVIGIVIAVAIPAAQHLRDMRDRKRSELREAKALALLLLPTLSIWIDRLSGYQRLLGQHLQAHFPGVVDWASISDALVLGEQGKLLATKTHLMGPVADDVQKFFYYLASAQQLSTDETSKRYAPESRIESVAKLDQLLQKTVESAVASREKVHQ